MFIFIKASPISNSLRTLEIMPPNFEEKYKEKVNNSKANKL